MQTSNSLSAFPIARQRHPFRLILGGCAVLFLCLLCACAANAGFWQLARRAPAAAQDASPNTIRAGLESLPEGSISAGERLFTGEGACGACHSLQPGVRGIGPSLAGIADRAATQRLDYLAELYLYESIIAPSAYAAAGFQNNIMPASYQQQLSAQQLPT
jgi:mono/diheme cytochrome c family protein